MKSRDIVAIGIPKHLVKIAQRTLAAAQQSGMKKRAMPDFLAAVWSNPEANVTDPIAADLATSLVDYKASAKNFEARESPAPYRQWGTDLEPQSVQQMVHACELPIAVRGALMPDAHLGYGLPIGGVLGTKGAVIPYAVGVDIACRVKLSVLDLPVERLKNDAEGLTKALIDETRFGIGAHFSTRRQHDVMDRDWSVTPTTLRLKDKAWSQLGSSGGGNHFVEFGIFEVDHDSLGLPAGKYLALLSHSGSRGTGAAVCQEYSKRAMATHPGLPKDLKHLAWLDLDDEDGQEYWAAMSLMGEYAAGNHACIHRHIVKHLGAEVLLNVENHHNFAWKEQHGGREVVVHRKGATPASKGELGVIPGSMASPAYVVRGKGCEESLRSASHGAGRRMSRKKAKATYNFQQIRKELEKNGVHVLSAGADEVPFVYKRIEQVMADQKDLVDVVARFDPKIVKMCGDGSRPED